MLPADTPMLFRPPRPPLPLPAKGHVVLGRSRSCDVCLPGVDASRRHAQIAASNGRFAIRDLGSTNGTYVNGERVEEERELRPGDRIQIGGHTMTFCQVGAAAEGEETARNEAQTLLMGPPAASGAFQGDFAEIPPFAVLQMLELGRKSGALHVEFEGGAGRLWLDSGVPVHAETEKQCGFDAALALVQATSGRFSFEPQGTAPERSITASVTELVLEASRRIDESAD